MKTTLIKIDDDTFEVPTTVALYIENLYFTKQGLDARLKATHNLVSAPQKDIVKQGRVMRNAQAAYFKMRTGDLLTQAKATEKKFDELLDTLEGKAKPAGEQTSMFATDKWIKENDTQHLD